MAANILLRMLLCCVLLLVSGVSRARDATAVESLLRADYSSVIIDGVRNQLLIPVLFHRKKSGG